MSRVGRCVAVALLGALLVGCSDDEPRPKMAPTQSAAPTTSSSVDPTPTEPPPEVLGPEDTVRAWVAARNETVQSGDSDAVYTLSATDCATCRDSVEPVRDVYVAGGRYETFGWRIAALKLDDKSASSSPAVNVGLVYSAGRTFPDASAEPILYDTERHIVTFRLAREAGVWKVHELVYRS
ncbi:hypothetical protein NPS01_31900 [Nocardioides psychrotolerans]|uniref:Lipoprotein n=1 Tax=Nocardioides psychrotolerans TaxID=1005945 RepID=A0A1I3MKH0_9ACTN|nr:hypothetical protein [Nocardioides psychrotolerans]GEP39527.1 hypothetical protein NPS01_31900 [Nocardioides psychrotolerans]SFI97215.1 hypothetical protein SAMN05216561_115119 [Nocardioides psychrotolerans]